MTATFALPSDEARAAMINGDAPYADVAALLFTHIHGDHSDPDAAGVEFLNAQDDVNARRIAAGYRCHDQWRGRSWWTALWSGSSRWNSVPRKAPASGSIRFIDFIEGAWVFHQRRHRQHHLACRDRRGFHSSTWVIQQPLMADFSVWDDTEFDVILYPYWFAQMAEGQAFLNSRPDARAIAFHIPASATPQTIRAGLGEREYLFGEGTTLVISAE